MDLVLGVIPSNSPSRKTNSKKSPLVFSSLENQNDVFEYKSAGLNKSDTNKLQTIRPNNSDSISKRYASSQSVKDNFYAIHHIPRINKETEEFDSENMDPNTVNSKKLVQNRGRKRLSSDATALNTTIHHPKEDVVISSPFISSQDSLKRKKLKAKKDSPLLFQTCQQIWPESEASPALGEFSHDSIKSLSDLLKVRLTQAKFKMMAKLDKENELFSFLAEEYIPPQPKVAYPIHLSKKHQLHRSTLAIVGNGKNLFNRQHNKQTKRLSISSAGFLDSVFDSPCSLADDKSPQRYEKSSKDRKKKTPKTAMLKTKRITTPKRRSAAADVIPITLSDGSSVYVCEPCNKKYKNRNGLAYHMERCKNSAKNQDNSDKESSQNHSNFDCICSQSHDENMTMIQCEKCQLWSHSECVGVAEDMLEEIFYCAKCKDSIDDNQVGKDLLQCLLEAQSYTNFNDLQQQQQQQQQLSQLQELLSQAPLNDQEDIQTEDERFTMNDEEEDQSRQANNLDSILDSSQLHIWDDFNVNSNTTNFEDSNQEQWNMLDDEEAFYDTDMPSSNWNMSDLNIFQQPPSLLFSDTTILDDESAPLISDLATPVPMSESTPDDSCTPKATHNNNSNNNVEGLWFQFANFDDDYHCENS